MRVLIFDMDGVLVDPAGSYRRALMETVEHFTGRGIENDKIVELKNQGGFNDDYILSHHLIRESGLEVPFEEVVAYYKRLFWGARNDGLILRERWMVSNGMLDRLARDYRLAIFTGRSKRSASFTLQRFAAGIPFDPVITSDHVVNQKPAPDGLLAILEGIGEAEPLYVGDNVDDARAARAAGVPFVAVVDAGLPCRAEVAELFRREGALEVLAGVNQLEPVLAEISALRESTG